MDDNDNLEDQDFYQLSPDIDIYDEESPKRKRKILILIILLLIIVAIVAIFVALYFLVFRSSMETN
jgi:ABC-type lipoprotein release transport system permease subunit